jgi:hypothetical protein
MHDVKARIFGKVHYSHLDLLIQQWISVIANNVLIGSRLRNLMEDEESHEDSHEDSDEDTMRRRGQGDEPEDHRRAAYYQPTGETTYR